MNIFKILSSGDGSLKEPNLSAFLAYLLDPSGDHGLHSKFLESFLKALVFEFSSIYEELKSSTDTQLKDLSTSSKFIVEIDTEVPFEIDRKSIDKKSKDIDIVIEIYKRNEEDVEDNPAYIFAIENKIRDEAIKDDQLMKEIKGLMEVEEYSDIPIGLIFLTRGWSDKSDIAFKELKKFLGEKNYLDKVKPIHLRWEENDKEPSKSVFNILSNLLVLESSGLIEPIHEYTKHTIKALINFIAFGFKSYVEEKQEGGKGKKVLWGPERYDEFKSKNKNHPMFNLLEEIHNDITQKYKNIRIDIAPYNKRISYKIDDERKTGNKFFHIKLKSESELEGFLRVEDAEMIPVSYYEGSNAYLPSIKSKEDYNKCKDLIKKSYDNILRRK